MFPNSSKEIEHPISYVSVFEKNPDLLLGNEADFIRFVGCLSEILVEEKKEISSSYRVAWYKLLKLFDSGPISSYLQANAGNSDIDLLFAEQAEKIYRVGGIALKSVSFCWFVTEFLPKWANSYPLTIACVYNEIQIIRKEREKRYYVNPEACKKLEETYAALVII